MVRRNRELIKAELHKRVAEDPNFRQDLIRDPKAALKRALDFDLSPGLDLRVLEDSLEVIHLVLPPAPPDASSEVSLREITGETVHGVCALEVRPEQVRFVAPNAISIAEAQFSPTAWQRVIYAGDTPVGFVMLSDDPEQQKYYLWRYMIDHEYQGLGFGRRAMELVIDYVRTRPGASEITLSYSPGEGSPRDFYTRLGFEDTGESLGSERVMRLQL